MKQKISEIDLTALMGDLYYLNGMRVSNVYDITENKSLIRFAGADGIKKNLIIIVGSAIYLSEFKHQYLVSNKYSQLTQKLRVLISNKRVQNISQYILDRIIIITFGLELENRTYLVIELFGGGNVLLLDKEMKIIAIKRIIKSENLEIRSGIIYNFPKENIKLKYPSDEEVETIIKDNMEIKFKDLLKERFLFKENVLKKWEEKFELEIEDKILVRDVIQKKGLNFIINQIKNCQLRKLSLPDYSFIDLNFIEYFKNRGVDNIFIGVKRNPEDYKFKGIIISKKKDLGDLNNLDPTEIDPKISEFFDSFECIEKDKFIKDNKYTIEFDNLTKALDIYFTLKDKSKEISKSTAFGGKKAKDKVKTVRNKITKRLEELDNKISEYKKIASIIETEKKLISSALKSINIALSSGFSWEEIEKLLLIEKKKGNPTAFIIKELFLEDGKIIIQISDPENKEKLSFELILNLSLYGNIQNYYNMAKKLEIKISKTKDSIGTAVASAKRSQKRLDKGRPGKQLIPVNLVTKLRDPMWMEKFLWFISTDGYLIIAGKNAQQNERLVNYYLNPGDIYLHAIIYGATSVIIKNNIQLSCINAETLEEKEYIKYINQKYPCYSGYAPIPIRTIEQAGATAACCSKAWKEKIPVQVCWVYANQVTKATLTKEYLKTGSFIIKGKRNFLPQFKLKYGYALIFIFSSDGVKFTNQLIDQRISNFKNFKEFMELINSYKIPEKIKLINQKSLETDQSINMINFETSQKMIIYKSSTNNKTKKDKKIIKETEISNNSETNSNSLLKRGTRKKILLIKKKYKDQDDEDRLLRMKQLGHKNPENIKLIKPFLKKNYVNEQEKLKNSLETKEVEKENLNSKIDDSSNPDPFLDISTQIDKNLNLNDSPEIKKSNLVNDFSEIKKSVKMSNLGHISYTGVLNSQLKEVPIGIIPISGPPSAFQDFTFSFTIQPGSSKKGTLCKNITNLIIMKFDFLIKEWEDKSYIEKIKKMFLSIPQEDLVAPILSDSSLISNTQK